VAGASVLANNASLSVVDVGVVGKPFNGPVVVSSVKKLVGGTKNFCVDSAMSVEESHRCIQIGRESIIDMIHQKSSNIVALGEVGIGNTTTASAVVAAMTGEPVESVCGGGAYDCRTVDETAIKKKIEIVGRALKKHKGMLCGASAVLSHVGGAEIAALVGAMLEASERNIPLLIDGFIVTTAALIAVSMRPTVCNVLFLSTRSAERGQMIAIQRIQTIARDNNLPVPSNPVLSMGLRMGEGTGALLAVPILQSAAAMVSKMATIQDILSRQ
jgi:nicotinate-nucleotide--dimethylbenzimidazole phosphoribosyltransferase